MKVNKSYIQSKTLWISIAMAIAPAFPEVQELIKENPEAIGLFVGGVFSLLRLITKKPLGLGN